jgi:hypothetical protein
MSRITAQPSTTTADTPTPILPRTSAVSRGSEDPVAPDRASFAAADARRLIPRHVLPLCFAISVAFEAEYKHVTKPE